MPRCSYLFSPSLSRYGILLCSSGRLSLVGGFSAATMNWFGAKLDKAWPRCNNGGREQGTIDLGVSDDDLMQER
jgi:hypothetical protein